MLKERILFRKKVVIISKKKVETLPERKSIEELNNELVSVEEEINRLSLEAHKWSEKRDRARGNIKKLRTGAAGLREKRNELNELVKNYKDIREQAKTESKNIGYKILGLKEKLEYLIRKKPAKNVPEIQKEIERLEWKIQTTQKLTIREEKILIDELRPLEKQLSIHNQILKVKDDIINLKTENEKIAFKVKLNHDRLMNCAEQSQIFHEKMLEYLSEIRVLKDVAEDAHQKYVLLKQQTQDFNLKRVKLINQIKDVKQKLRLIENEKQVKRQLELRREIETKASEKLRLGKKLTWEEFRILAEKGVV